MTAPPHEHVRVAVFGATGYIGSELIHRLLLHPRTQITAVYASDFVGDKLARALPNLEGRTSLVIAAVPEDLRQLPEVDVAFLALPHTVSFRIVEALLETGAHIIDCSGAFRVDDPAEYERFYGARHPLPQLLPRFVYGLSELNREAISKSRTVASPGCFATTIELGLLPLAKAGLLEGAIHTVAITGSSGAGSNPLPTTHHPVRSQTLRPYKPLTHPHAPEILETLTRAGGHDLALHFVPVAAPLARGILATSFAHVPADVTQQTLDRIVDDCFAGSHFIRRPEARLPEVIAVSGSNFAEVKLVEGPQQGSLRTVTSLSVLDNLLKGGAGQAIQNMNLMLGFEESLALDDPGSFP